MREELEKKLARFEELEKLLYDPAVQSNSTRIAAIMRERGSLGKTVKKYRRFKDLNKQVADAMEMIDGPDAELRELAEAELPELKGQREQYWNDLLDQSIGGEDANRNRCVMEIRAGTGGDEAALFARDLFEMYKKHAEVKKWKFEILDASPTELGGFKEIVLAITGEDCYRQLQYESGGHRVQRVPKTETKGRVHTSAATVAVMAEPEDMEIQIKPEDFRKDTYHASGPGGQHVNKTASAVRLTHHESGIVVQCQDGKSQHKNFAQALRVLKTRLYDRKKQQEQQKRSEQRKNLVGSGDRSQKIRTYNFPDNRVSVHRINKNFNLENVLDGNLQSLTDALVEFDRQQLKSSMRTID